MPFGLRRSTLYVGEIWFWKRRMFTWLYWLYVLLNNIWIGACAVVYYKWGDIVLGANQSDTKRDLSDLTWMLTMFTTGMGIALLYFGVSEPIYNLEAALSQDTTYNDASQHAFLVTYLHFGLHAWAPFVLVGVMLGLAHHRHGLPLTMRSAFYPLLRERTFGWAGDAVDLVTALCSLVGVAVPLALASMQLAAGFNWHNGAFQVPCTHTHSSTHSRAHTRIRTHVHACKRTRAHTIQWLKRNDGDRLSYQTPIAVLFACNFLALLSVATQAGAHKMAAMAAFLGIFLALDVLFMENTWFILDLFQQSLALYMHKVTQLSQHLDVFERLDEGLGVAGGRQQLSALFVGWEGSGWLSGPTAQALSDAAGAAGPVKEGMQGGQWGWVLSMTPVAGIWLAKVSRGRTIRQVELPGVCMCACVHVCMCVHVCSTPHVHVPMYQHIVWRCSCVCVLCVCTCLHGRWCIAGCSCPSASVSCGWPSLAAAV